MASACEVRGESSSGPKVFAETYKLMPVWVCVCTLWIKKNEIPLVLCCRSLTFQNLDDFV